MSVSNNPSNSFPKNSVHYPLPFPFSIGEESNEDGASLHVSEKPGERPGNPDLFAQYAHVRAGEALKQIDAMKSRGYNGEQILNTINRSRPALPEMHAQLLESHEAKRLETRQKRAHIASDIDNICPKDFRTTSCEIDVLPKASEKSPSASKWDSLVDAFTRGVATIFTPVPGERPHPPEERAEETLVKPRIATAKELSDAFSREGTSALEPVDFAARLLKEGTTPQEKILTNKISQPPEQIDEAWVTSDKKIIDEMMLEMNMLALVPRVIGVGIEKVCNRNENLKSACKAVGKAVDYLAKGAAAFVENSLPDAQKTSLRDGMAQWASLPHMWENKYGIPENETRHFKQSCKLRVGSVVGYGVGSAIAKVPQAIRAKIAWTQLPKTLAGEEPLLNATKPQLSASQGISKSAEQTETKVNQAANDNSSKGGGKSSKKPRKIEKIPPQLSSIPVEYASDALLQHFLKRGAQVVKIINGLTGETKKRAILSLEYATNRIRELLGDADFRIINGRYHYDFAIAYPMGSQNALIEFTGSKTKQTAGRILHKSAPLQPSGSSPPPPPLKPPRKTFKAQKIGPLLPEHLGRSPLFFLSNQFPGKTPYTLRGEILLKKDTLILRIDELKVPQGTLNIPAASSHIQHLAQKHQAKWIELIVPTHEKVNQILSQRLGSPSLYREHFSKFRFSVQETPIDPAKLSLKPLSLPDSLLNPKRDLLKSNVSGALHPEDLQGIPLRQINWFGFVVEMQKCTDFLRVHLVRLNVNTRGDLNFFSLKSELETIAASNGLSRMRLTFWNSEMNDRTRQLLLKRGGLELARNSFEFKIPPSRLHDAATLQKMSRKAEQAVEEILESSFPQTESSIQPSSKATKIEKMAPEHLGLSSDPFLKKYGNKSNPYGLRGEILLRNNTSLLENDTLIFKINWIVVPEGTLDLPSAYLHLQHLAQKHYAKWIEIIVPTKEQAGNFLSPLMGTPIPYRGFWKFRFPVLEKPVEASELALKPLSVPETIKPKKQLGWPFPNTRINIKEDRLKLHDMKRLHPEQIPGIPRAQVEKFWVEIAKLKNNVLKAEVVRLAVKKKGTLNFFRLKSELEKIARLNDSSTLRVILPIEYADNRICQLIVKRKGQEFRKRGGRYQYDFDIPPQNAIVENFGSKTQQVADEIQHKPKTPEQNALVKFLKEDSGSVRIPTFRSVGIPKFRSKEPSVSSKQMIRHFEDIGYGVVPGGGKDHHVKMQKSGSPTIRLPHDEMDLKKGFASRLWKILASESKKSP